MAEFKDWIGNVEITNTLGCGWCVRIDGCDIFDPVNHHGVKGRKSFSISSDLKSEEEAKEVAKEWLLEQLSRFN